MELKIYIPTYRRVYKQTTLNRLPEDIQKKVFLVVPPDEVEQHKANKVKATVLAAKVKGIGEKRNWIMAHAKKNGFKRIVMLDDDLTLQKRRDDMKITNLEGKEFHEAFKWMDDTLKKYAHATFGMRFLGYADTAEVKEGARAVYVLGYNVKQFFEAKADFTKGLPNPPNMEDFHVTLHLLTRGYPNLLSLVYRCSPYGSNLAGGCSVDRNAEDLARSAKRLTELYPGLVKLRAKKGWYDEEHTDVTVQWQKALKEARR